MSSSQAVVRIGFKNNSGESIPRYSIIQFTGDSEQVDKTKVISVLAVKPDGTGPYAINMEADVANGQYGECIVPLEGLAWIRYIKPDPPATAWETEVGPRDDEWDVDDTGTGYLYAGLHEPDNERILVMQLSGGGGNFIEGRLTSAMTPASNSLTGATTFTFRRYVVLDGSVTPKILEERDEDETGVNRDTTLSADVDAYIHCKRIQGEWRPSPVSDVCVE